MKEQLDLFSLGEVVIDFIPGTEPHSYIRTAGGAPANVAISMVRNGLKAGVCCSVGADDFGTFLIETMEEDGDRSFTFARKPGADMFLYEADILEEDIARSAIIHAGTCPLSAEPSASATVKAMRLGHEQDKIVSFDINYRNLMWNDDEAACIRKMEAVLPYVDILKISEEEVHMLGGEEKLFACMKEYDISVIVMTLGSEGARCYYMEEILQVAGRKATCVDATGAGDAFLGGFLSCLRHNDISKPSQLTEEILQQALIRGNVSGWLSVQSKGAITSLPTETEIARYR